MKRLLVLLPLLVVLGCSKDATAGCTALDVGVMTTVTSESSRVNQSNQSTVVMSEDCFGASGSNVSSQTSVTDGNVTQQRSSTIIIEGDRPAGRRTRSVQLQLNPRTNVEIRETR